METALNGSLVVGRRIQTARGDAGLTLDQLAARISTTRQVIIGWEHGRHLPNRDSRRKLEAALDRDDLFAGTALEP